MEGKAAEAPRAADAGPLVLVADGLVGHGRAVAAPGGVVVEGVNGDPVRARTLKEKGRDLSGGEEDGRPQRL